MNLHQAQVAIIGLAALALLLLPLGSSFDSDILIILALLCFLLMMVIWFLFRRCPHCGKHLGQGTGARCPHCGKKL